MEGIFGVGLPEMLIVALALFVVGGPKNTAKWAREMGVWVRKARAAWTQMMAELENEIGPEGKEVLDTARELSKGAREVTNFNPTKRAMNETLRMMGDALDVDDSPSKAKPTTNNGNSTASESKYSAWIAPDSKD